MASTTYPRPTSFLSTLAYLLCLLTTLSTQAMAESTTSSAAPTTTPSPTHAAPSTLTSLPSTLARSTSYPTGIPSPNDASDDPSYPTDDDDSHRLLNYFFLLLLALVATIVASYFLIIRRRQQRFARQQGNRQDALAHDLERWNGWGMPWRGRREERVEGLNENGEAPPAYMPERPAEAHAANSQGQNGGGIPLQDMHKPPDYEEGSAGHQGTILPPRYG